MTYMYATLPHRICIVIRALFTYIDALGHTGTLSDNNRIVRKGEYPLSTVKHILSIQLQHNCSHSVTTMTHINSIPAVTNSYFITVNTRRMTNVYLQLGYVRHYSHVIPIANTYNLLHSVRKRDSM